MSEPEFQVALSFDYFATFLWALSGAIVGMHKRYDFAGVLIVALLSSTGGSLLRDGIFLQQTPPVLGDRWYIPLILVSAGMASLLRKRIGRMVFVDRFINVIDAVGVPAFAVVGMQLSLQAGIPLSGVVLVGVVNGFGGGFLRDLVVGDTPSVLRPGVFALSALIVACVLFLVLTQGLGVAITPAAWSVIAFFFLFRTLSIRYNWQTKPILPELPP
jgi:uncharacterized membrane protein YeiH